MVCLEDRVPVDVRSHAGLSIDHGLSDSRLLHRAPQGSAPGLPLAGVIAEHADYHVLFWICVRDNRF